MACHRLWLDDWSGRHAAIGYSYEGEEQVIRLVTSGVACRMVAVSDSSRADAAASCVGRSRPEPR